MMPSSSDDPSDRRTMYREMQRAIPGLDAMYRLVHALIASHDSPARHVLVVGAGGGREIEEFGYGDAVSRITAVDPSARNLETARAAAMAFGTSPEINFIVGTVKDVPEGETFAIVTSLLVMHHLPDDGTKLAYLKGLRRRLASGGLLIHADVCFDEQDDLDWLIPAFEAHARAVGVSPNAVRLELDAIPKLPVVSENRTRALFSEAGLTEPREVLRSLWYRCWVCSHSKK